MSIHQHTWYMGACLECGALKRDVAKARLLAGRERERARSRARRQAAKQSIAVN